MRFSYDASGNVVSVDYSDDDGDTFTTYYYLRNAQGDIVKLIDGSGNTMVEYTYDSWGKPISVTGTLATTLGANQPFRYRGYVYDADTQWYYLQSRYYDPTTCRFISADYYLSTGQWILGHNSFAYCLNNPINRFDPKGAWGWKTDRENVEDGGNGPFGSFTGWVWRIEDASSVSDAYNTDSYATNESSNVGIESGIDLPSIDSGLNSYAYTEQEQIVVEWAKEASRGISEADAKALVELAKQVGLPARGPEIHPGRSGWSGKHWHIHVGSQNHILVIK